MRQDEAGKGPSPMPTHRLPQAGNWLLSDVAALFAAPADGNHPGEYSCLRIVAVPSGAGHWGVNAGSLSLATEDQQECNDVISVGPIRLVECVVPCSRIQTGEGLGMLLAGWGPLLGVSSDRIRVQDSLSVNREPSGGAFGAIPHWHLTSYQHVTDDSTLLNVRGPFFDRATGFFAGSLDEVAALWLRPTRFRPVGISQNMVGIAIPDARAYFGLIDVGPERVAIEVHGVGGEVPLSCACLLVDVQGREHRTLKHLTESQIEIPRPDADIHKIELHLLGDDGFLYDELHEDEHRHSRLQSVLYPARALVPVEAALLDALASGEGETVEFKEWLPLSRERPKSGELLRVVSAFANGAGGSLFVGVSDALEVLGTDRAMRAELGTESSDLEDLRASYAKRLKRMLGEGLTPGVRVSAEWISIAGRHVLRIAVPANQGEVHSIVESRETFVRKGANCARASAAEIETLINRRSAWSVLGRRAR